MTGATLIQRYLLSMVAVRLDVATLDFLTETLLDLPMSYFSTRRTGDIERRLAGRAVRCAQFLVHERRPGADRGHAARRGARR